MNASKFAGAKSAQAFNNTKKIEQEKAQVVALQNIRNENLLDNPKNGEDITMTLDLEESMKQNGFTDPMEVTDFGMEPGKYMILSGHRRRAAGVKVFGSDFAFPCILRRFQTAQEVQNYTLMANSQRDSAKDPCLFCARYKMHEAYLDSIDFKGSKREEIAKRLGISVQQADRYNKMNSVILPVWDMVRAEIVGMSSVVAMGTHSEAEQLEILKIMKEAQNKGATLTRDTMKKIVDGYRTGKKTWAAIADLPRDSGLPLNGFFNTDSGEAREQGESNRNDEVRRDFDPIAAEYDAIEQERSDWENQQAESGADSGAEEEAEDELDGLEAEGKGGKGKQELTPEEKKLKLGADIAKQLSKLDTSLQSVWGVEDEDKAREMEINIGSVVEALIDEAYRLAEQWNMGDEFEKIISDVVKTVDQYK